MNVIQIIKDEISPPSTNDAHLSKPPACLFCPLMETAWQVWRVWQWHYLETIVSRLMVLFNSTQSATDSWHSLKGRRQSERPNQAAGRGLTSSPFVSFFCKTDVNSLLISWLAEEGEKLLNTVTAFSLPTLSNWPLVATDWVFCYGECPGFPRKYTMHHVSQLHEEIQKS